MENDLELRLDPDALTTLSAFVRLGRLHALPETSMLVIDTIQAALDQMMLAMLRERRAGTIVRADMVDRFLDDVVTGDSDVIRFVHPDSVREIVRLFAAFTAKQPPTLKTVNRSDLEQFIAELEIALDLETHAGTDPAAWIEGVITKLKELLKAQDAGYVLFNIQPHGAGEAHAGRLRAPSEA